MLWGAITSSTVCLDGEFMLCRRCRELRGNGLRFRGDKIRREHWLEAT